MNHHFIYWDADYDGICQGPTLCGRRIVTRKIPNKGPITCKQCRRHAARKTKGGRDK